MKPFSIVVLAAGKSSRMGTPKQLLRIGKKTFIERVLENAKELNSVDIICILGANAQDIKPFIPNGVEVLYNENWTKGMGNSLAKGIGHLNDDPIESVMILLADQPIIEVADLKKMLEMGSKYPHEIIASDYHGSLGVPAIFPKKHFPDLTQLEGNKGAKEMLMKLENQVHKYEHSSPIVDIDTQEEYLRYLLRRKSNQNR